MAHATPDEHICVIGLGYIGLPTAAIMAMRGFQVTGVDINPEVVEIINQGRIHIYEPELDAMVQAAVASGRLRAQRTPCLADVFIVAVPTPFREGRQPDVSYVEAATRSLAAHLRKDSLVILESTSPVGTTEAMARWITEVRPDLSVPAHGSTDRADVLLAHCPERVLPGHIIKELVENDRIIGGIDSASTERTLEIYRRFVSGKLLTTDCRTAEMTKLTENTFRDVNIAFANELSIICDRIGVDVWNLIELANHHPRVKILRPGPGVGGHCIAVDPWFIVASAPEDARLIRTAREVNDGKPAHVLARIAANIQPSEKPRIACLGLAFKADVDDLRESPAVDIAAHLAAEHGDRVLLVEPYISEMPRALAGTKARLVSLEEALVSSDIIVLLVDHRVFKEMPSSHLVGKRIIDTRGIWR